jgi:hypothetical protein
MQMKKKIPFIRTGRFTDKNGTTAEIKPETLDKIIASTRSYPYQNGEFPVVIGHPKEDSPAWGWISKNSIVKEKNILSALADDSSFAAEFREWISKKLYKTVSVALRPDWSIKHIGFLGAQPPAVTGLPAVEFSSSPNDIIIELSEGVLSAKQFGLLSSLFSGIKNYFIEKEGEEKAEELIPSSSLEEMTKPAEETEQKEEAVPDDEKAEENSEEETPAGKEEEETDPSKKKKGAEKNLSERFIALQLELKAAQEETEKLKRAAKRKEHLAFCESAEAAVKIKPAERNAILGLMEILDSAPALEFSEGDETISVNPLEAFKEIIKNQKPVVELSEIAARDKAVTVKKEGSPAEISKRAIEIKSDAEKLGESMNFAEAVTLAGKEFNI